MGVHTGMKGHICMLYNKAFWFASNMSRHTKIHEGSILSVLHVKVASLLMST